AGVVRYLSGLTQEHLEAEFARGRTFPVPGSMLGSVLIPGTMIHPPTEGLSPGAKALMARLGLPGRGAGGSGEGRADRAPAGGGGAGRGGGAPPVGRGRGGGGRTGGGERRGAPKAGARKGARAGARARIGPRSGAPATTTSRRHQNASRCGR